MSLRVCTGWEGAACGSDCWSKGRERRAPSQQSSPCRRGARAPCAALRRCLRHCLRPLQQDGRGSSRGSSGASPPGAAGLRAGKGGWWSPARPRSPCGQGPGCSWSSPGSRLARGSVRDSRRARGTASRGPSVLRPEEGPCLQPSLLPLQGPDPPRSSSPSGQRAACLRRPRAVSRPAGLRAAARAIASLCSPSRSSPAQRSACTCPC